MEVKSQKFGSTAMVMDKGSDFHEKKRMTVLKLSKLRTPLLVWVTCGIFPLVRSTIELECPEKIGVRSQIPVIENLLVNPPVISKNSMLDKNIRFFRKGLRLVARSLELSQFTLNALEPKI